MKTDMAERIVLDDGLPAELSITAFGPVCGAEDSLSLNLAYGYYECSENSCEVTVDDLQKALDNIRHLVRILFAARRVFAEANVDALTEAG